MPSSIIQARRVWPLGHQWSCQRENNNSNWTQAGLNPRLSVWKTDAPPLRHGPFASTWEPNLKRHICLFFLFEISIWLPPSAEFAIPPVNAYLTKVAVHRGWIYRSLWTIGYDHIIIMIMCLQNSASAGESGAVTTACQQSWPVENW